MMETEHNRTINDKYVYFFSIPGQGNERRVDIHYLNGLLLEVSFDEEDLDCGEIWRFRGEIAAQIKDLYNRLRKVRENASNDSKG